MQLMIKCGNMAESC